VSRLGPLAERDFRLLFLARVVSFLGSAIAPIGLAFAILDLTGSKSDLGLVLAARSLPQVIFLLVGGIWADRLPRHHVMVVSNVVSGASQLAAAALLLAGNAEIWQLAAFAAVNGTASAFFFPASSGIVPQVVSAERLQEANALLRLGVNAAFITGAAVGGLLVAAVGPGWALAIDGVSYLVAALLVAPMRLPARVRAEARSFLHELAEGWYEVRSRTWLWTIVVQFSLVNAVLQGSFSVLGPAVADAELGGAKAWGLIVAAQSAGLLTGGLLALRFRPQRILLVASLGILLGAPELLALGVPLPTLVIAGCSFVAGLGVETFGVLWDLAMQQNIPTDRLSRVYSYDALGSFVFIPVGQALAGPVADLIGVRETLWGAAAVVVGSTLAVLAVRDVRELRRRQPAPAALEPQPELTPSR
jgi:MFS family permease